MHLTKTLGIMRPHSHLLSRAGSRDLGHKSVMAVHHHHQWVPGTCFLEWFMEKFGEATLLSQRSNTLPHTLCLTFH